MPDPIKKLQELFSEFPTIGRRTAGRFVYYLLKLPKEKTDELIKAIQELKNKIRFCIFCFNPHETQDQLCQICQNQSREKDVLCIVEKENDLISIENTKKYNGLYFILGGALNLRRNNSENIRTNLLVERIKDPGKFGLKSDNFSEIIIATNPTPEGRSTSVLIERTIKEKLPTLNLKITHLAIGLPFGGEIEYADDETMESAFEGRK